MKIAVYLACLIPLAAAVTTYPPWKVNEETVTITKPATSFKAKRIMHPFKDQIVRANAAYYFKCKARLLEYPKNAMWANFNVHVIMVPTSGGAKWVTIGRMHNVRRQDGWVEIGGDFETPSNIKSINMQVSLQGENIQLEIMASTLSLVRLLPNSQWKAQANQRITALRKGDLTINLRNPNRYTNRQLKFKLEQVKSGFPVGSALSGNMIAGNRVEDKKYQEFFFKNFNWGATENDLKWRIMEGNENKPNYNNGDKSINALKSHNFGSRAHTLLWGRTNAIPRWMPNKSNAVTMGAIRRRLKYMADHYGKKFDHFDVNNEQLHEAWYAQKLNNPNLLAWTFKEFHRMSPSSKLFLNDFFVFGDGIMTLAYKQQVLKLKKARAPLHGIGMQSHFGKRPKIETLMKRLEILGELNLPLWLTEFDINIDNANERNVLMAEVLRLAFSHPKVGGIIFWGFWDKAMWRKQSALVAGSNFQLTTTGRVFQNLFFNEWKTKTQQFALPGSCSSSCRWNTDGFAGTYQLTAILNGKTLWTKDVELQAAKTSSVSITI